MKKIFQMGVFLILLAACISVSSADFVHVSWADFKGDKHDEGYDINMNWVDKQVDSGHLYAGVHLPEGAIIKNMRVLLIDTSADYNVTVRFIRSNMYLGTGDSIFEVSSSGSSGAVQSLVDSSTDVASNRKVYTNVLTYSVQLYFSGGDGNIKVYGVVFEYE